MNLDKEVELCHLGVFSQTLFNQHPDSIYVLDLEGKFAMANAAVCRLTGMEKDQLIAHSFEPLIHPAYQASTLQMFLLATQDNPRRYETAIITPEGVKHLDVTNFPLKVEDKVVAVLGIAKDITERHLKELKLQENSSKLQAQIEELEVFRKIIAHDMRKPVANAIGFAKLLEGEMLPMEAEKEVKSLLLKTVESADAIIRDLNEVLAQKSKGDAYVEPIWLDESIKSIVALFANDIKLINASVLIQVAPQLSILTVKAYFNSIIRNLLSNAMKYHSRFRVPAIYISAVTVEDGVEISVKDNGIGMDMASMSGDLFKIHKRFAPTEADGHGVGLYIVQRQVKLLGGTISVSSELGIGTEFKIFLPFRYNNQLS